MTTRESEKREIICERQFIKTARAWAGFAKGGGLEPDVDKNVYLPILTCHKVLFPAKGEPPLPTPMKNEKL